MVETNTQVYPVTFNPLCIDGLVQHYILDESMFQFRGIRSMLSLLFNFWWKTSCCSNARPAQPGPIRWLGPFRSHSVIKLVSVLYGKCTALEVTKCWPMETRLLCGDQWKAEKLGAFWRWPITRCFIESDKAGLIIEYSINFCLNGEHWRAVKSW